MLPTIASGNVASATASTTFDVTNSCRFNDDDSAKMAKTPGSNGSELKFTLSCWVKRGSNFGSQSYIMLQGSGATFTSAKFDGSDRLDLQANNSGAVAYNLTNRRFRDPSAWYHIVWAVDTTQGTAGDRVKVYVNGVEETSWSSETTPSEDAGLSINHTSYPWVLGAETSSNYFDGYMAEVVYIDGTQYAASDFGSFDADSPTIWKPKDPSSLTFGTNGFYLDFKDSANLGNDANGGTDLTETNIDAADSSTDTPTNNFCTFNPLDNYWNACTFTEGNNSITTPTSGQAYRTATFGVARGKWYWEVFRRQCNGHSEIGIAGSTSDRNDNYLGNDSDTYAVHSDNGYWFTNGSGSSWVSSHNSSGTYPTHLCMCALDLDNNKFYFGINGTWEDSGDPTSGATGTGAQSIGAASTTPTGLYFPAFSDKISSSYNSTCDWGFGATSFGATAVASANQDANDYGNFEFAVPSGYFSLCSKNLAEYG